MRFNVNRKLHLLKSLSEGVIFQHFYRSSSLLFSAKLSQIQSTSSLCRKTFLPLASYVRLYRKNSTVAVDRYPLSVDCQIRSSDFIYPNPCMWPTESYLRGNPPLRDKFRKMTNHPGYALLISHSYCITNSMVYGLCVRVG